MFCGVKGLLKRAVYFKNDEKVAGIDTPANRIMEHGELNEEAVWLQAWVMSQAGNAHQAQFQFESFAAQAINNAKPKSRLIGPSAGFYSMKAQTVRVACNRD